MLLVEPTAHKKSYYAVLLTLQDQFLGFVEKITPQDCSVFDSREAKPRAMMVNLAQISRMRLAHCVYRPI